jgi:putative flippase GtrA
MAYRIIEILNSWIANPVHAQSLRDRFDDVFTDTNGTGSGNEVFAEFVKNIYAFALPLAITISILLLVFGAFKLITSAGDPDKLSEAKEIITNAIMGVIMIGIGIAVLLIIAQQIGVPLN